MTNYSLIAIWIACGFIPWLYTAIKTKTYPLGALAWMCVGGPMIVIIIIVDRIRK